MTNSDSLRVFVPEVHTQEAMHGQLRRLNTAQTIVVGSVGRAALFGGVVMPYRAAGESRDIDIVLPEGDLPEAAQTPFRVDYGFCSRLEWDKDIVRVTPNPKIRHIFAEVDADLFEPYEVHYGAKTKIRTFHPDLMANFSDIIGAPRKKDIENLNQLRARLADMDYPRMSLSQLEPIREVAAESVRFVEEMEKHRTTEEKARRMYNKRIPVSVREKILPLTAAARRLRIIA